MYRKEEDFPTIFQKVQDSFKNFLQAKRTTREVMRHLITTLTKERRHVTIGRRTTKQEESDTG